MFYSSVYILRTNFRKIGSERKNENIRKDPLNVAEALHLFKQNFESYLVFGVKMLFVSLSN